jgi:hypothetical protein
MASRASPPERPRQRSVVEIGAFGFGIHDGIAGTFGGGVLAGYRLLSWLAIGAWLEGSGEREQAMVRGQAAYHLYDLGVGLTAGETVGPVFVDASVLPELTLLTVEGKNLNPGRSISRWGAAADGRIRLGLALGAWRPFFFVGASYAFRAERLTLDDYPYEHITLRRGNASYGLGLAYCFGADRWDERILQTPSPGFDE